MGRYDFSRAPQQNYRLFIFDTCIYARFYRIGSSVPWIERDDVLHIKLNPLRRDDAEAVVARY